MSPNPLVYLKSVSFYYFISNQKKTTFVNFNFVKTQLLYFWIRRVRDKGIDKKSKIKH